MLQQTLMFLAGEAPASQPRVDTPATQAAAAPPPAGRRLDRFRLALTVAGNTLGFSALLTVMWYSLWLMQALLPLGAQ